VGREDKKELRDTAEVKASVAASKTMAVEEEEAYCRGYCRGDFDLDTEWVKLPGANAKVSVTKQLGTN